MAVVNLIIGAGITLLLVILCFILIRKKWLAFIVVNMILLLASGALAYSVFNDFNDMKQNFFTEPKLLVMKNNGRVIGAFSSTDSDSEPNFLDESQFQAVENSIQTNDFSQLETKYYKIIVVDSDSFASLKNVEIGDTQFTHDEVVSIIDSSEPIETFLKYELTKNNQTADNAAIQGMKQKILEAKETPSSFRAKIFSIMFGDAIKTEGASFLLKQYKEGNIMFYPETITFSIVKLVPDVIVEKIAGETNSA